MENVRFYVAVGKTRLQKVWQNKETDWLTFAAKLKNSIVTGETAADYQKMSKDQRGAIKDVGGFVGAYLDKGLRQKAHVTNKTLITLDLDAAPLDYADKVAGAIGDVAYCVYSTHSHTPERPRVRVVVPLTKPVTPDAYLAVSRKVAEKIGMAYMDPTTFAPERLMFWPSRPRDVEPVYILNQAPILNPDDVLALYPDWKDTSAWPICESEAVQTPETLERYTGGGGMDPRGKPGIVGAFCKAYTIKDVITMFLSNVYAPFKKNPNRYTYINGSSVGGLHIFAGGLMCISFHATDPISGLPCNAFDFARIHLYGYMDANPKGKNGKEAPSYKAMRDACLSDGRVMSIYNYSNNYHPDTVTADDFDDTLLEAPGAASQGPPPAPPEWLGQMETTKAGAYKKTANNLRLILANDPRINHPIAFDMFAGRVTKTRRMPWDVNAPATNAWTDTDDACLRNYLDTVYGLQCRGMLDDALSEEAHRREYHPVRDWFNSLDPWDGVERVRRLFIDYLGAADNDYNRTAAQLMCRAVVARIFRPGCKFDYLIVLTGGQGIGKSTLLRKLGGKWFTDSLDTFTGKDAIEQLQGKALLEASEMQAANKADAAAMKSFISRQVDNVRLPYERRAREFPRQCVLVGTTNDRNFLKDLTGNRRNLVIDCQPLNLGPTLKHAANMSKMEIEMTWAEALEDFRKHYRTDADLCLPERLAADALTMQEDHMENRELIDQITSFLDLPIPEDWHRRPLEVRQAWIQDNLGDDIDVNSTINDNVGGVPHEVRLMRREYVCVREIVTELLGKDWRTVPNFERKNVFMILAQSPDWIYDAKRLHKVPGYGPQRCFKRIQGKINGTLKKVTDYQPVTYPVTYPVTLF